MGLYVRDGLACGLGLWIEQQMGWAKFKYMPTNY